MKFFHLDSEQNISGPYTGKALLKKIEKDKLSASGFVLRDGTERWIPVADFRTELSQTGDASDGSPQEQTPLLSRQARIWIAAGIAAIAIVIGVIVFSKAREENQRIARQEARRHPLSEWYLMGYEQGANVTSVARSLDAPMTAGRAELIQILGELGVVKDSIPADPFQMCLDGFEAGVAGNERAFDPPESQTASILPAPLDHLFFADGAAFIWAAPSEGPPATDLPRHPSEPLIPQ